MTIVSRIIHVQVDRRLNVTNKFKYQRRLSSRLAIVMFRGTLCILRRYGSFFIKGKALQCRSLVQITNVIPFLYFQ